MINENATSEEFDRVFFEIANELHEAHDSNPQEDIVVISVFAGHGILKNGTQWLVANEYDENE